MAASMRVRPSRRAMSSLEATTPFSSRSMSSRLSSRINRVVVGCALAAAFAVQPAFAAKKDDDYKLAQAAEARGDAIVAAKLYCALRDEDEKFKDVAQKCTMWMNETRRMRTQDEKRLADGEQALKEGRLDDAEDALKKIKIADLAARAKDDLNKIAALRSESAATAGAEAKFQQGVQAYN